MPKVRWWHVAVAILLLVDSDAHSLDSPEEFGLLDYKSPRANIPVLFVSIGIKEHFEPLRDLAVELSKRGHAVTFASHSHVEEWLPYSISFYSLGILPVDSEQLHRIYDRVAIQTSVVWGARFLFTDLYLKLAESTFLATEEIIFETAPGLVVADFYSFGAAEACHKHEIPIVYNTPSNNFGFLDTLDARRLPAIGSGYSREMTLYETTLNFFVPFFVRNAMQGFRVSYKEWQTTHDIQDFDFFKSIFTTRTLVNTAVGFEYPYHTLPNMVYTGPIVPSPELAQQDDLAERLNLCGDRTTVLAYFGSAGTYRGFIELLLTVLKSKCVVLVSAERIDEDRSMYNDDSGIGSVVVHFEANEANLWQLLGSSQIEMAISSCDLSFAQQCVLRKVPQLCIPLFGDHADVAARVRDAGVGLSVEKVGSQLEQRVAEGIAEVANRSAEFRANCETVSQFLNVNGLAASRGADAVIEALEMDLDFSTRYAAPCFRDSVDIAIGLMAVFTLVTMALRYCFISSALIVASAIPNAPSLSR